MNTTTEITATTAAEAVAILATVIGQKNATFYQVYFERGNKMDVYTHEGDFMIVDKYGMALDFSFPTGKESDDFCYQYGNGQTNVQKVMAKVGTKMTIEIS
jgi:hypothetical protein